MSFPAFLNRSGPMAVTASCDVLLFDTMPLLEVPQSRASIAECVSQTLEVVLARPSEKEPFGIIVRECASCGLHVDEIVRNSIAHRDGRIAPGDVLVKLNDHSVRKWTTADVSHGLRGLACKFTVRRGGEDGECYEEQGVPSFSSNTLDFDYDVEELLQTDSFLLVDLDSDSDTEIQEARGLDFAVLTARPLSEPHDAKQARVSQNRNMESHTKHIIMRTSQRQPLGMAVSRGGVVAKVSEDSLAAAANITAGMRIVSIGKEPVAGLPTVEIADILKSKCGVFSITTVAGDQLQ